MTRLCAFCLTASALLTGCAAVSPIPADAPIATTAAVDADNADAVCNATPDRTCADLQPDRTGILVVEIPQDSLQKLVAEIGQNGAPDRRTRVDNSFLRTSDPKNMRRMSIPGQSTYVWIVSR